MLKRHHISGLRQTIFSGMVIFLVGAVLFVSLRPSVFSRAQNIESPKPSLDSLQVIKFPTEDENIKEETITAGSNPSATYIARPQGLPIYTVTKVIDGNSVDLDVNTRVRLVGIKAPELDEERGVIVYVEEDSLR